MMRLAILIELWLVTDRQTDRRTDTRGHSIYRASIASRVKNIKRQVYMANFNVYTKA